MSLTFDRWHYHNIKNTLTGGNWTAQMLKTRLPELKEPDIIVDNVRK
jgi:DNA-binding HxlR family transcriptional regulator